MPDGGDYLTPEGEIEELLASVRDLIERYERAQALLAELNARMEVLAKEAIPGTIEWRYVSCGKASCRKCPHGPYAYLKYPSGKSRYLGKKVPDEIWKGVLAWHQLRKLRELRAQVLRKLSRAEKEIFEIRTKLTRAALWLEGICLTLGDALHKQAPGVRQNITDLTPGQPGQEHADQLGTVRLYAHQGDGADQARRSCT